MYLFRQSTVATVTWVWVEFKWLVGRLPQMCLFKGKLEVKRCRTDTGHMHVGLRRISVSSHVKDSCSPEVVRTPLHHLCSHFRSQFFKGTLFAASLDLAVLHRKCVVFTFADFLFAKTWFSARIMFGITTNLTTASGNQKNKGLPEC